MDATPRKPYPSDLTDAQWALLEPMLPPPIRRGRAQDHFRDVLDAIFYLVTRGGHGPPCLMSSLPRALSATTSIGGSERIVGADSRHAPQLGSATSRKGTAAQCRPHR